jgi:hypothetical protein
MDKYDLPISHADLDPLACSQPSLLYRIQPSLPFQGRRRDDVAMGAPGLHLGRSNGQRGALTMSVGRASRDGGTRPPHPMTVGSGVELGLGMGAPGLPIR